MQLEELVVDALDPQRLGGSWEAVAGDERLTDEPDGLQTRLAVAGGPVLDLCPERAPEGATKDGLHLDVRLEPGEHPDAVAAAVAERGGSELHPGRSDLPWRSYLDPSGNELCVLPARS